MKKEWGQEAYQFTIDGIPVKPHERFQLLRRALNVLDLIPAALHAQFIDLAPDRPFPGVPEK